MKQVLVITTSSFSLSFYLRIIPSLFLFTHNIYLLCDYLSCAIYISTLLSIYLSSVLSFYLRIILCLLLPTYFVPLLHISTQPLIIVPHIYASSVLSFYLPIFFLMFQTTNTLYNPSLPLSSSFLSQYLQSFLPNLLLTYTCPLLYFFIHVSLPEFENFFVAFSIQQLPFQLLRGIKRGRSCKIKLSVSKFILKVLAPFQK